MRPEAGAAFVLPRPRLERQLEGATDRRLTAVVAGAGYGKTTLLTTWAGGVEHATYSVTPADQALSHLAGGLVDALRERVPDLPADLVANLRGARGPDADEDGRAAVIAAMVCDALHRCLAGDLVLVLDGVDIIEPDTPPARLVEALCRQAPQQLHLVLGGRHEPPFRIERLRAYGDVLEITAAELAFTADETAKFLSSAIDGAAAELAGDLHEATGGWPVAVRLAVDALRNASPLDRKRIVAGVRSADGPLFDHLAREVFDSEPLAVRELVRTSAAFERVTPALCERLGQAGAATLMGSLVKRGLLVEARVPGVPAGRGGQRFALAPLIREFALYHFAFDAWELDELHAMAAEWFLDHGDAEAAVVSLAVAGETERIARLLAERGGALLAAGAVDVVLRAVEAVPPEMRGAHAWRLLGEARHVRGDWDQALTCFVQAEAAAGRLDAGLAWRMGVIHYLRGELDQALAVYARARTGEGEPREDALLLAWTATAHWAKGDVEACRELVDRAMELATRAADPQALASAHTIAAMLAVLEGDRIANDAHYRQALAYAERAGDILQVIRVRTNRSSHHQEEGAYAQALVELEQAIPLADLSGFVAFQALGLHNRGDTYRCLGRLEQAIVDLEAAKRLYLQMGSNNVCHPLRALGDVYRARGDVALARGAYEEAIRLSEEGPELQSLVPALAGLSRLIVADAPEEARRLAERAMSFRAGLFHPVAVLAAGHAAWRSGRREEARQYAGEAAAGARSQRDRATLAEALELQALVAQDGRSRHVLDQAAAIWREIGDPIGQARVDLATARIIGGEQSHELALVAERKAREVGAHGLAAAAAEQLAVLARQQPSPVAIRALGDFQVLLDGRPLPAAAWQSKKARDLLKILVARRGRPVPRTALMEALWPDDDPGKLANRLSVALSTVRAVLDPDKRHAAEPLVVADPECARLDIERVAVDVEAFLSDAAAGLKLRREGRIIEAAERLARAEAAYTGAFLEESPYDDWAVPLREEARAAYIQVLRVLAAAAVPSGDHETAVRCQLRILEHDPFDERAHLDLVSALAAAGSHGEARRRYRDYTARMAQIDVEAAPFPTPQRAAFKGTQIAR